jgi:hypothetical protein
MATWRGGTDTEDDFQLDSEWTVRRVGLQPLVPRSQSIIERRSSQTWSAAAARAGEIAV